MRSIRLSLMVYFLGLLAVALGVASVLVYRSAQQTLHEKELATSKLIQAKFEQRAAEESKRLDDNLLDQASSLAGRLKINMDWSHRRYSPPVRGYHVFGVITAAFAPCGYVNVAPWLAQVYYNETKERFQPPTPVAPFAFEIWRTNIAEIHLNESELQFPTGSKPDYFQIDTNHWGKPLRSVSLRDRTAIAQSAAWAWASPHFSVAHCSMALWMAHLTFNAHDRGFPDPADFGADKLVHWEVDDFELSPGHWVRRVRVKASSARREMARPPRNAPRRGSGPPMPPGSASGRGTPPRNGPRYEPPQLYIVLQVASNLARLDEKLAGLKAERDAELDELKAETAETLFLLRNRLLGISSVTFLATVLGSFGLVWLGLVPLRRVSEAVSKVSPRDFRLQLDDARLPVELQPIVERLTGTLELLKRAFAREKQATADISHELRTPLAAMLTNLELALRKQRPPEQYRDFLQECHSSALHMHQIVERLLTLARLDAGVDRLRPQPVDVADLAEQCATVVRPLAEARGLKLEVHNPADPSPTDDRPTRMHADPDKLREVLNNLLHNAIQYNRPAGRIDVHVVRDNGIVRLEVCDTGIGIPPESRERIFERFYRADPSRSHDGLNAGLGLAIVKEYVDLMGGCITVESQEGQGSTFRIDLPVARERQARRPMEAAP